MIEDINKIIEQHLPAQMAGVLKERIEKVEQLESDVKKFRNELDLALKRACTAEEKLANMLDIEKSINKLEKELKTQELDLEKRERNLELTLTQNELASSERCNRNLIDLMGMAFRNPRIKHQQEILQEIPYKDSYGNDSTRWTTTSTTTTIEEE